jgi:hypothetical protein
MRVVRANPSASFLRIRAPNFDIVDECLFAPHQNVVMKCDMGHSVKWREPKTVSAVEARLTPQLFDEAEPAQAALDLNLKSALPRLNIDRRI